MDMQIPLPSNSHSILLNSRGAGEHVNNTLFQFSYWSVIYLAPKLFAFAFILKYFVR